MPDDSRSLPFRRLTDFEGARDAPVPLDRLAEIRRRGERFRERFLSEPEPLFYASFDLIRAPYPALYAYTGVYAQAVFKPLLVHLLNRLFVVQFRDFDDRVRTLLFSPTDHVAGRETPFFKRMSAMVPERLGPLLAPVTRTVDAALEQLGIRPEQVDYLSYDHLHTQDVRRWLGTGYGRPAFFPHAKLLIHRQEWTSSQGQLPCQAEWYCPHGIDGVDPTKVILFDGDIQLGPGVALVHTPGHTEGNHSLVCRTSDGIRVTSENGVGADAYAPQNSRVNAIRRFAKATGVEVILNGNTLEGSNQQYLSMVLEKTIAGPSRDPSYPNCASSSEATPTWMLPGTSASYLFGEARFGSPVVP